MVRNRKPNKKRCFNASKILQKVFNGKARSLATTITSIIPFPNSCVCNGRSCIQCCENPMSFLIRPDDPWDYNKLLHDCFVVVDDDAPFLDFFPDCRWSQKQIVEMVIQMMSCQRPKSCNLLCAGYNQQTRPSMTVELLTTSAWNILHERIGDECMVYLLRHTSIFVPLSGKTHFQVAGFPISNLCKSSMNETVPLSGARKKRKRTGKINSVSKKQHCGSLNSTDSSGSGTGEAVSMSEKGLSGELKRSLLRPFTWKRHKKLKLLNIPECIGETSFSIICSNENFTCSSNKDQMPVQCSCYLMLDAPLLVSNLNEINRLSMFYNSECSSSVLPREHVLITLPPKFSSSKYLMANIFGLFDANVSDQSTACSHAKGCSLVGSSCLYHSFLKSLKSLIRRTKRCNHAKLLEKYCPLPSLDQKAMGNSTRIVESNRMDKRVLKRCHGVGSKEFNKTRNMDDALLESTRLNCLQAQVVKFIWAVCGSIVPPELLGTPSNQRILRSNIFKFIRLRRFEKFSVQQCMYKLKPSDFPFLSNNHKGKVPENDTQEKKFSEAIKHKLFVNWISWFFSSLVVPLVQANFYVTETDHGKVNLFYYRKPVWEMLTDHTITCLKGQSFIELDDAAVRDIINRRPFGFSKLRLCPKQNGVRMLANLNSSSRMVEEGSSSKYRCSWMHRISIESSTKVKHKSFMSVNSVLRGTHAVLKGLMLKEPEKLGSSVFDYDDVYRKLCPFLTTLKSASATMPGVFVVVADVSKAFDSVNQDKLLSMMEDVIVNDQYNLQQIGQVACSERRFWYRENLMFLVETANMGFADLMSSVSFCRLPGILVNQGCSCILSREELFSNLYELIKHNVVQLNKKFYLQKVGIPQGSVLSNLLCSLYYGHMEKHVIFPYLEKTSEPAAKDLSTRCVFSDSDAQNSNGDAIIFPSAYSLLRFVDDFLFISTSKEQASRFLSKLREGFPDYNCYMNESKFCLNFDFEHQSGILPSRIYVEDCGTSFIRWCGMLINSESLEIQGDYSRFLNNHLSSSLSICYRGKLGRYLKRKLCDLTTPRCHPIFFDSNINSASVVRLNVYQAFLLCAMRFHLCVSELSDFFRPREKYCLKIIVNSLRYMYKMIKKRMVSIRSGTGLCPILRLRKEEVIWLGLNAYMDALSRKHSRYRALLSMLRSRFFGHRLTGNESSELRYAVARSHSSTMWRIEY